MFLEVDNVHVALHVSVGAFSSQCSEQIIEPLAFQVGKVPMCLSLSPHAAIPLNEYLHSID